MSDTPATRAKAIITGCPEVWNRVCHIDQVTFDALVERLAAALAASPVAVNDDGPTVEEMSGLVEDFTGGQSLKEHMDNLRGTSPVAVWTKDVPEKEGWYWYRNDTLQDNIVQVYEHPDLGMHMSGPEVTHCRILDLYGDEDFEGSEFAGPIPPPQEGGTIDKVQAVPTKRTCNAHEDCDEADAAHKKMWSGRNAKHCNIEDCEDCFGQ